MIAIRRAPAGSSPRVRGTHRGSTASVRDQPVHPRACGEHSLPRSRRAPMRFIPARAGNAGSISADVRRHRFIPARAGNASSPTSAERRHRFIPARAGNTGGDDRTSADRDRFIPARAGNTLAPIAARERRCRFIPARAGNTAHFADRPTSLRFIPARAGNAHAVAVPVGRSSVHPRACGERSCLSDLCQRRIHNVKQRTDVPTF